MRASHYITLLVAVLLIGIIYWGGNTTPPKKEQPAMADANGPHQHDMGSDEIASFDTILSQARTALPAHAIEEIKTKENQIEAIRDSSRMASTIRELAELWQQHKQYPVAAYYYAKSAKLENSEKSLNFAGQLFLDLMHQAPSQSMQLWEAGQAIESFKRSLELNPDNDTVKLALASGYIEGTGETMQGVQMLLGITKENPANVPANLMLGRLSIQSGQFDKAIQRFETVLKEEPKNTEALYFLAEAYKGKGNKEKAIELFEKCKAIVNNPNFSKDIDQYINSFK